MNGVAVYSTDFTREQLYSTRSYQDKNLIGMDFFYFDATGWDFNGQDLTGANFNGAGLTNADFTGAILAGVSLDPPEDLSRALTKEQLYSTQSYRDKNLRGISL